MIVGILGGIGSGKSTVTRMLVELGAEAVDADALAHEVLESPQVRKALVEWLGPQVLQENGRVNRQQVAQHVFSAPSELKKLEKLVHPEVIRRIEEKVKEHEEKRERDGDLLVLDVPLLFASTLRSLCSLVVFVDTAEVARKRRVEAKGWKPGELEERERLQTGLEEKRQAASHVIYNSGTLEETRHQVEALFQRLQKQLQHRKIGK